MFKTTILSFCLILFCFVSFAQKDVKFGEIDKATVENKVYEKDKNAVAVVLYDYTKIQIIPFTTVWKQVIYRHKRIKVLNKEGLQFANIVEPYYIPYSEKIVQIKGYTYNLENGEVKKTKLEKEQIFDVKINKNYGQVKISMPNVREGSVIDISYRFESDNAFLLEPCYLQSYIPIQWAEVETLIPDYFRYVELWTRTQDFYIDKTFTESTSDYRINGHKWVMKDVPAFSKDEKFVTSPKDYMNHIKFQMSARMYNDGRVENVMPTWEKFIEKLMEIESFGGYLKKNAGKDIVIELIKDKKDTEKLSVVFDYIKNNFKFNSINTIYANQTVKDVLEKKTGNSAEINLLLVNSLRFAGIEAHPVILSTRFNGRVVAEYPIADQFNYCVVYAKDSQGKEYLLDATNSQHTLNMIAERALTREGLLILPQNKHEWIPLNNPPKTSTVKTGFIEINTDGTTKGKITTQYQGYKALKLRNRIMGVKDTLIAETINLQESEISKIQFKNVQELNKPIEFTLDVVSQKGVQQNGDFIYITPLMNDKIKENPFKQEKRDFSIDFTYPTEETYVYTFVVPENYTVEEIPQSIKLQWADGKSIKFDYLVKKSETTVQINCKFFINRVIFEPEEYQFIKDMFAKILAKQEEQIVLKKK
ncbi:MAG: DUF3857 domain-containing protein [Raineya sp.]|jgi:hypothetical protein|nr:DUF3857 domain-containing protein [Raineya sp.]